jgi:hypothetical protein
MTASTFAVKEKSEKVWTGHSDRHVVLPLLALEAFALLLEVLGFVLATFLLQLFLFKTGTSGKWIQAVSLASCVALGSWIVFSVWLKIPLPKGVWL